LSDMIDRPGASFYLYVDDVDSQHTRAVAAGMTEVDAPTDMFWGDRMSSVDDIFGQRWHARSAPRKWPKR